MKSFIYQLRISLIFIIIIPSYKGFSSVPKDSTFYVITNSLVKFDTLTYIIDKRNAPKTIYDKITFTSVRFTDDRRFKEDTIILLNDTAIIYLNKIISIKREPFKINGYKISNARGLEQPYEEVIKKRTNSMYFFRMMQKLNEPSTVSIFDPTNVKQGIQKKPYILHANIQTPIAIGGYRGNIGNSGFLFTAHLVPQFRVRIFQNDLSVGDSSRPVRTPSYMPGGKLFLTHERWWNPDRNNNHFIGIRLFHHSNGQDGAEFRGDTVNVYNGNFGEELVWEFQYGGYYASKPKKDFKVPRWKLLGWRISAEMQHYYIWSWKIGYEYHPYNLSTDYFRELNFYGRKRLNINLDFMRISQFNRYVFIPKLGVEKMIETGGEEERWRLSLNATYILDENYSIGNANDPKKVKDEDNGVIYRTNIYLTAYLPFRGTPYTAFFIEGGYYGSDPYNIYFQYRMWYLRFGVALHFFNI